MPRLNLLTEDDLYFRGVLLANQREYKDVYGVEHLCGVWADIVEIELESVECRSTGCAELLAAEFRCESHIE